MCSHVQNSIGSITSREIGEMVIVTENTGLIVGGGHDYKLAGCAHLKGPSQHSNHCGCEE